MGILTTKRIITTSKDLGVIVNDFVQYLTKEGFKTQQKVENGKAVIQAQKGGILRDLVAADRAITFTLEKQGNQLLVTAGIGKWLQNLAVTAIETLLISPLFLAVDVPEMLWTEHVEKKLLKELEKIAQS